MAPSATAVVWWAAMLLLTAAGLSGCAAAPAADCLDSVVETGLLFRRLDSGERFAVYVPRCYDPSRAGGWPAIVFLNGKGECGKDGQKQIAVGLGPAVLLDGAAWPFVIVFPQKPDAEKEWEEYDRMVMEELEAACKEWQIDPARIGLTGLSQGGHGAWVIASLHTDVFSAVAPICGYGAPAGVAEKLAAAGASVWAFHGLQDAGVSPDETRRMVEAIRSAAKGRAVELKMTLYPDLSHACWDRAYQQEKLGKWFMEQRRR